MNVCKYKVLFLCLFWILWKMLCLFGFWCLFISHPILRFKPCQSAHSLYGHTVQTSAIVSINHADWCSCGVILSLWLCGWKECPKDFRQKIWCIWMDGLQFKSLGSVRDWLIEILLLSKNRSKWLKVTVTILMLLGFLFLNNAVLLNRIMKMYSPKILSCWKFSFAITN